jgi:hypothetical protein
MTFLSEGVKYKSIIYVDNPINSDRVIIKGKMIDSKSTHSFDLLKSGGFDISITKN